MRSLPEHRVLRAVAVPARALSGRAALSDHFALQPSARAFRHARAALGTGRPTDLTSRVHPGTGRRA
eukprot:15476494-Alexandrium_andersonii.AAC.1